MSIPAPTTFAQRPADPDELELLGQQFLNNGTLLIEHANKGSGAMEIANSENWQGDEAIAHKQTWDTQYNPGLNQLSIAMQDVAEALFILADAIRYIQNVLTLQTNEAMAMMADPATAAAGVSLYEQAQEQAMLEWTAAEGRFAGALGEIAARIPLNALTLSEADAAGQSAVSGAVGRVIKGGQDLLKMPLPASWNKAQKQAFYTRLYQTMAANMMATVTRASSTNGTLTGQELATAQQQIAALSRQRRQQPSGANAALVETNLPINGINRWSNGQPLVAGPFAARGYGSGDLGGCAEYRFAADAFNNRFNIPMPSQPITMYLSHVNFLPPCPSCTPTLQFMASWYKQPITVYFQTRAGNYSKWVFEPQELPGWMRTPDAMPPLADA